MLRKLMFIVDCIPKERELLKLGYDIFIYKDDIEEYINSVQNKVIKIIELKNYSREIPDELVDTIERTRDIFNGNFYVLFTDYTGKEERRVEKERREKDPLDDNVVYGKIDGLDHLFHESELIIEGE